MAKTQVKPRMRQVVSRWAGLIYRHPSMCSSIVAMRITPSLSRTNRTLITSSMTFWGRSWTYSQVMNSSECETSTKGSSTLLSSWIISSSLLTMMLSLKLSDACPKWRQQIKRSQRKQRKPRLIDYQESKLRKSTARSNREAPSSSRPRVQCAVTQSQLILRVCLCPVVMCTTPTAWPHGSKTTIRAQSADLNCHSRKQMTLVTSRQNQTLNHRATTNDKCDVNPSLILTMINEAICVVVTKIWKLIYFTPSLLSYI